MLICIKKDFENLGARNNATSIGRRRLEWYCRWTGSQAVTLKGSGPRVDKKHT